MSTPEKITNELCPNCGNFVVRLVEFTGFCFQCSLPYIVTDAKERKLCECGKLIGDDTHKRCRSCRDSDWLLQHADELDRYLAHGLSISKARKLVQREEKEKPKGECRNCGGPLPKSTNGEALFCMKPECRTVFNKYRRLIYTEGLDRRTALRKAVA